MPVLARAPRPLLAAGIVATSLAGQFATRAAVPLLLHIPGLRAVDFVLGTALIQVGTTVVIPYLLAWWLLGLTPQRLGIGRPGFGRGLLYGCAMYAATFVVFITWCAKDPGIAGHVVLKLDGARLLTAATGMCLIAAGTDLATRGFILLGVAEYSYVSLAVVLQNAFWLWGHRPEIMKLSGPDCIGLTGAIALFVALGILGDVIALRTRNVLGLAIGHILLNVAMIAWIRAQ